MPVTVEQLMALLVLEERRREIKLGTYLYNLGKSASEKNPTEDIRELREDRYAFRGR